MKIGILYICTGKYDIFWKDFYLSCENNFLKNTEKHYIVFTDSQTIEFEESNSRIHRIYQKNLGWPQNTLYRYKIFLNNKQILQQYDYLVFLNANLLLIDEIEEKDFLPTDKYNLVACLHPGYFNKKRVEFTYENRQISKAYIPNNKGAYYFAGGINGGKTKNFMDAIELMSHNIDLDIGNKIIAVWHDESHWNKYLLDRDDIKILNPSYLYPQNSNIPFKPKIIIRDKGLLGGHSAFRGKFEIRLALNFIKKILKKYLNYYSKKNIINIKGGLGNQMFQYAYGRKLILVDKKDVIFDTSFFKLNKTDTDRPFLLNNFNVDNSSKIENVQDGLFKKYYRKLASKITGNYGFYQNEKYFKPIEDIVHKEFTLKEPLSAISQEYTNKILDTKNAVSIHIRRGDYVLNTSTNKHHGVCSLVYYNEAVEYIIEKIESPTFFIFSDDIDWVKANLKLDNTVFVSSSEIKDCEELILMSKCKHNIIANSSFSWWGAWLNQNPNKIVIAPKQWTVKKTSDELDILPKGWIKM